MKRKPTIVVGAILLLLTVSGMASQTVIDNLSEKITMQDGLVFPKHETTGKVFVDGQWVDDPGDAGQTPEPTPTPTPTPDPEPTPDPNANPFDGPIPWDRAWTAEEATWIVDNFASLSSADMTTFFNNWRFRIPQAEQQAVVDELIPEMAQFLNAANWPYSAPFDASGYTANGWHVSSYTGLYDDLIGGVSPDYMQGAYNDISMAHPSFWGRMESWISYPDFTALLSKPLTQSQIDTMLSVVMAPDAGSYLPNLLPFQILDLRTQLLSATATYPDI